MCTLTRPLCAWVLAKRQRSCAAPPGERGTRRVGVPMQALPCRAKRRCGKPRGRSCSVC
ncbi:hypothetical protein FA09DRAFT_194936 [Tilletiopsis washingtonensis]|uniref:Uncharacterized protein n=1 Tax=Tilletiopsis washingtonensis TaxID=58919 RepID=A0A316YZM4_9BASI|nr:hypothetical protein FA09DRAFT_194936 [Tilletiopsis washingtonensis]PWN94496.1 hypothetical protein FA09DRAFT_194936 [Tilletiopsis washingtonensis]